ncbi:MAG: hypothetical protein KDD64_09605 [Bdellovibrionales bacterium]|nr:hypothetical protein [Bdellovibrionales bacterium]
MKETTRTGQKKSPRSNARNASRGNTVSERSISFDKGDAGKAKRGANNQDDQAANAGTLEISTSAELKQYLLSIRDKMADGSAPAIYCLSAMNNVMSHQRIYELLDKECKELARDIWLRIKQAGVQLKNPPLLFSPEEEGMGGGA